MWYFRLPGADREGGDEGAERLPAVPQVTVLHAAVALPVLLPGVLVVGWDEGEEGGDGGRPLVLVLLPQLLQHGDLAPQEPRHGSDPGGGGVM